MLRTFFLLALVLAGQDPDPAAERGLRAQVQRLSAEQAAVREDALHRLKEVSPALIPWFRKTELELTDPEAKSRVLDVIDHLLTRKADTLWAEGKLPETLKVLAEKARAQDVPAYVDRQLAIVRDHLKVVMQPDKDCAFDSVASELLKTFGRWALQPLLEKLGDRSSEAGRSQAAFVLLKMTRDAAPALCWALQSERTELRLRSVEVLERLRDASPLVLDGLRRVRDNSTEEPATRERAAKALKLLEPLSKS